MTRLHAAAARGHGRAAGCHAGCLPLTTATTLTCAGAPRPPAAVLADARMRWSGEIPFENLDVVLGKQISIEPAVIESTLVLGGRGG